MLRGNDLVWAAGLLDGEGCVYIGHNKKRGYYRLFVQVGMTHKATVDRLQRIFGNGRRWVDRRDRRKEGRGRSVLFYCVWSDRIAEKILLKLLPFVFTKRREVVVALRFRKHIVKYASIYRGRGKKLPKRILQIRNSFLLQLKFLKRAHHKTSAQV